MKSDAIHDLLEFRRLLAQWAETWGLPGLEQRLEIKFSSRFRTSLGLCAPAAGEIRLASFLLTGSAGVLREALCHEAAHAAVYELHGRGPKPHGAEWQGLMRAAEFEPRAKLPSNLLPNDPQRQPAKLWEHRCPVCHASRLGRRRVPQWSCAACRGAGLAGALIVTRIDNPVGSGS